MFVYSVQPPLSLLDSYKPSNLPTCLNDACRFLHNLNAVFVQKIKKNNSICKNFMTFNITKRIIIVLARDPQSQKTYGIEPPIKLIRELKSFNLFCFSEISF